MTLNEPKSAAEWKALREQLRQAEAQDYPGVDPARFAEFKRAALHVQSNFVGAPIMVLVVFLSLTEYVLQVVNWGAIGWLMALVLGAAGGGIINAQSIKNAQSKTLSLGRELGLFGPGPGPGPGAGGEASNADAAGTADAPLGAARTADAAGTAEAHLRADEPGLSAPSPTALPSSAVQHSSTDQPSSAVRPPATKRPTGLTVIAIFAIIGGTLVVIAAMPYFLMSGRPLLMPSEAFRFIPPPMFGLILLVIAGAEITSASEH